MEFSYVAYTADRRLVKGKLNATNEEAATDLLSYGGYQVVSLKEEVRFFNKEKLLSRFYRIKTQEVIMFSRQLALLLESGTDIVTGLELLQDQMTNRNFSNIIGEVASDIRGGAAMSSAMSKHPRAFSQMYYRAIAAGEQGGNLEIVLRQMADFLERQLLVQKKVKNALTYPIIVGIVAIGVVIVLATTVLPAFVGLYESMGSDPPAITKMFLSLASFLTSYGIYLLIGLIILVALLYSYIRTPNGKYQWDKLSLRLPIVGRINQLTELARICRTIALLFKVGLPLPEILALAINASDNKIVADNLTEVQQELIRGEGLSRPMNRRKIFLPLMVQMVKVGEETGALDNTVSTVAESFEVEADDKTTAAVNLIQPVMTIMVGLVIAFVALSLVQTMYSFDVGL
jgi:type IV pilus assembly protein PilC